jgi:parallel beta-helix repeat protein
MGRRAGAFFAAGVALGIVLALGATELVEERGVQEPAGGRSRAVCSGVDLGPGDDLQEAIDDHPERTTFCLDAGVFEVPDNLEPADGTRLVGSGIDVTILTGTGARIIVDAKGAGADDVLVKDMTITGSEGTAACKPSCGSGFTGGEDNRIDSVRFHDHPNHGIGGSDGGLLIEDSILDHNGSEAFTGCCAGGIKGGTGFTIRDSEVFANVGVGIWCDVGCAGGMEVYGNHVYGNTRDGIRYEISDGGAVIENNVVENNNTSGLTGGHGGITSVGSANAFISGNELRGNKMGGIVIAEGERGFGAADIVIAGNELAGDALSGCSIDGVRCD